ncbi:CorA family divalent cation transporter [Yoonia sp.]|uniref:CorA family divalent cation transporter n=1 Tax=Yoonia sp. TaxID=2212373 RepID=UPI0025F40668|nr:CorA family divalent cation transporter [Yoonia sp.]
MNPEPLSAFDVLHDGTAVIVSDTSAAFDQTRCAYRWLHFDLATQGLTEWCAAMLPPLAGRALLATKTRPHVEINDDGLLATFRGVNFNEGAALEDMVSLRLWMTDKLVVTVRKDRVFAMEDLAKQMLTTDVPPTPARLVARVTENLVARIEQVSLDLELRTDQLEEAIYDNDSGDVTTLAPLRRSVIKLRRHIGPMSDALKSLATIETVLISKKLRHRLRDTANRATRSVEEVHEVSDRLIALGQHIDLNNDTRLARNSYVLSVIAAIFLPLGFLTGLFGVNVGGMPGVDSELGFLILCLAMATVGGVGYLILRWIKWF